MSPRDTRTGLVLEKMILPALEMGGYSVKKQVDVGLRPNGKRHRIDLFIQKEKSKPILISLKWQQSSGTAEQKVPFEIIRLNEILDQNENKYKSVYLVLGGKGWTLKEYYLSGKLKKYLKYSLKIKIVDLETFISKANHGEL